MSVGRDSGVSTTVGAGGGVLREGVFFAGLLVAVLRVAFVGVGRGGGIGGGEGGVAGGSLFSESVTITSPVNDASVNS